MRLGSSSPARARSASCGSLVERASRTAPRERAPRSSAAAAAFVGLFLAACGSARPATVAAPVTRAAPPEPPSSLDWSAKPNEADTSPSELASARLAKDPDLTDEADELASKRSRGRHPTGTPEPTAAPQSAGERCLAELTSKKVRFRALDERPGVETPVRIDGPIGGVTYFAHGLQLIVDCRLGLALVEVAPLFARHGVTRVRFSGAYVYRNTRHGKLSLHANGLALDVHALATEKGTFEVERDFERGVGCKNDAPLVNRVACELKETALFREVITPDYDADHRDHLHVALPRLPSTPTTLSRSASKTKAAAPSPSLDPKTPALASAPTTPAQVKTSVAPTDRESELRVQAPTMSHGSLPEALPERAP